MPDNLRIDGARLWSSLQILAEIGATELGGVCRLALTEEDKRARDLFVRWAKEASCNIRVDALGNLFAQRAGKDPARPAVLMGSHLDTQPNGGRFDGAYGVMAGLEVMRTLNDAGLRTLAPIEVVAWTNEEGTRFAASMMGSAAFAGLMDVKQVHASTDAQGRSFLAELKLIGYLGEQAPRPAIAAYFEAHIEQGPLLEDAHMTIGVVTGGQGQYWYDLAMTGQDAHAGTTPMASRRDALVGAAEVIQAVRRIGTSFPPGGCATVGRLEVSPNSRNVIAREVAMTIEVRHPDDAKRMQMDGAVRVAVQEVADRHRLQAQLSCVLDQPATPFDADCIGAVRNAAQRGGYSYMDIVSGAAHDAIAIARVAPAAMVFVPCAEGISHNEAESAEPNDLTAGCQVLLDAVLAMANRD